MKIDPNKLLRSSLIIYAVILTVFLGHVFFCTDMLEFLSAGMDDEKRDYTAEWRLDSGEYVDIDEISAGKYGGSFAVSKTLPETMKETDSIYFSTSNLRLKVYVDGEQVYNFDTRKNMTGTGDGISYHMIGLGSKDQGNEIRIEAKSAFADRNSGRINEMQYGKEELYRYSLMKSNFLGVNLSLLMIIVGVVIIAFYFGMSRKNPEMRSLWALGLSAVLFGAWSC